MKTTGRFITLEGIEGTGKSTHAAHLSAFLENRGIHCRLTREPGGTPAGEAIRELLLHRDRAPISAMAELMLVFAARTQHLEDVIRPALDSGVTVICDRFTDASYAYQGGGRGISDVEIEVLERLVQRGLQPDLTLLFDAPVQTGLARARSRGAADRFEAESADFFGRVRDAYLRRAAGNRTRIRVIDAARSMEDVRHDIESLVTRLFT